MKLTLIRHGMTRGNMLHIYYGSTDLPILPESYAELEARAKTGFYPTAERYYTSGMLRAEQSFRAIYGDTPHSVLYGMREADFGDFEMRNYAELKDDPAYIEWISGNNEDNICPNGESGAQVTARALEALKPVISEGVDAVVVAHGGVIGGVLAHFFPNPNGRFAFTPAPGDARTASLPPRARAQSRAAVQTTASAAVRMRPAMHSLHRPVPPERRAAAAAVPLLQGTKTRALCSSAVVRRSRSSRTLRSI